MASIAYVGLDVHKEAINACIVDSGTGETIEKTLVNEKNGVVKAFRGWSSRWELRVCYEASGAGFVLKRWLDCIGVSCDVIAPSLIPKAPGDHVKTDKRDARHLAIMYAAGALKPVRVPSEEEEAVRAVLRLRADVTKEIVATKNRVIKYLRTLGRIYEGKTNWTKSHLEWIKKLDVTPRQRVVVSTYMKALEEANDRKEEVDKEIQSIAQSDEYRDKIDGLKCLKGLDVFSAMALLSEIGDIRRFAKPGELMSYFGLVVREYSTGKRRRTGSITKSGNSQARWILIEAGWNQIRTDRPSPRARNQWKTQPPEVVAIAKKAHKRLHYKFWKVASRKERGVAVTAVAREMAGFVWAILTAKAA